MDSPVLLLPGAALPLLRDAVTLQRQQHAGLVAWEEQRSGPPDDPSRERAGIERNRQVAFASFEGRDLPLALVAHRDARTGTPLRAGLLARDWDVLDSFGNGADAVALLVTHQPDVLLVSSRMAGGDGIAILHRAGVLAPSTRLVAQVDASGEAERACQAGAHMVVPHTLPPADLVRLVDELRVFARELAPRR